MSPSMSRRAIEVTHVVIESQKAAVDVRTSLETLIPPIDEEIPLLLSDGVTDRLKQRLEAAPELSIFLKRDHGVLVGLYGKVRDAVQYEIGNPLTASKMTRYQLAAGLYAPLRVIIYEKDDGGSCIEYDLPSSFFGQFGDERITEVARGLDVALARALSSAAGERETLRGARTGLPQRRCDVERRLVREQGVRRLLSQQALETRRHLPENPDCWLDRTRRVVEPQD